MTIFRKVMLFICVAAAAAIYCISLFGGFQGTSDSNDYAALARNIIEGKGFIIGHIYPLSYAFFKGMPLANHMWAPLYPLYQAFWFLLFGAKDNSMQISSIVLIWSFMLSAYFLGKKILDEKSGMLAAVLIGLSQIVLNTAIDCTPEILAGILLTLCVLALQWGNSGGSVVLSGILFGLTFLTRYQMAIIIFPIWLFFFRWQFTKFLFWCLAAGITIIPWFYFNLVHFGNPIFTLQPYGEITKGMGRFDDYYYTYRSLEPITLFKAFSTFPLAVLKKFIAGIIYFISQLPVHFSFLGFIPFMYGILKIRNMPDGIKKFFGFSLASLILLIVVSSIGGHHHRYLVTIQVLLTISMLIGFLKLLKDLKFTESKMKITILTALLFLPSRAPFQEIRLHSIAVECKRDISIYTKVRERTEEDAVIFSDVSDGIWWYARRNAIWIPIRVKDIMKIQQLSGAGYVFLRDYKKYISGLKDDELLQFLQSIELVSVLDNKSGLYKLKKI